MEKFIDSYIGDIAGGLIREAAMLKAKCAYLESVIEKQKKEIAALSASTTKNQTDTYINTEHFVTK